MRIKSRTLQSLKIIVIEVAKIFVGLDNCNIALMVDRQNTEVWCDAFVLFFKELWYSFEMKPESWLVFVYSVKGAEFLLHFIIIEQ